MGLGGDDRCGVDVGVCVGVGVGVVRGNHWLCDIVRGTH